MPMFDQRTKPSKNIKDKEGLYEDVLAFKQQTNKTHVENIRLKTKIHKLESEMAHQEKYIEDLLVQQSMSDISPNTTLSKHQGSHITNALKRQIRDLKIDSGRKENELTTLKRTLKNTKLHEFEIEMKLYVDECT